MSLSLDIYYIKNYIELEKERFSGFTYSIEIDEEVPIHKIPIPPLLLQPLAEHTIWQYLSNSSNNLKKFCILITKSQNKAIIISIYNEGVTNSTDTSQTEETKGIKLDRKSVV